MNPEFQTIEAKVKSKFGASFRTFTDARWEQTVTERFYLNKLYALDVEVFLAQRQDLCLYLTHIKGIKKNKPELENFFIERDIRTVKSIAENDELDPRKKISIN